MKVFGGMPIDLAHIYLCCTHNMVFLKGNKIEKFVELIFTIQYYRMYFCESSKKSVMLEAIVLM